MADLREMKPQYISNVAVDYWRKTHDKPPYGLISISPQQVERIDQQPGESDFQGKLDPGNFKVADAMTISASVKSASMEDDELFRDLQILLGLAIRKSVRSSPMEDNMKCGASMVSSEKIMLFYDI